MAFHARPSFGGSWSADRRPQPPVKVPAPWSQAASGAAGAGFRWQPPRPPSNPLGRAPGGAVGRPSFLVPTAKGAGPGPAEELEFGADEDGNFVEQDGEEDRFGLEDGATEETGFVEEDDGLAAFGEEEEPMAEEEMTMREGDLALDEIPEEHREAVEGNMQLKRALSKDVPMDESPDAKRRKLMNLPVLASLKNPLADALVKRWRLQTDSTTLYVMRLADDKTVAALSKTPWSPMPQGKRTQGEQVYEKLQQIEELQGPPGTKLDAGLAFCKRWHLQKADEKVLAEASHKALRHLMKEYDGSRSLVEVATEGENIDVDFDLACPEKTGNFVVQRHHTLELLDPFGDALVLGDANLTFSIQLAEHRKSLHHLGRTVGTTFEKIETLRERYTEIDQTVTTLEDHGCEVMHNVDCTRLAVDPRFQGMEEKFGAVYYNFPHAGVVSGWFDSHPFVRWRHANLMHLFFRALRSFVKPGGSVKVASNSNATGIRYSDIVQGAANSEFVHDQTMPFHQWTLCRYRRSYGDRRDATKRPEDGDVYASQRADTDMVYCFTYRPSGDRVAPQKIRYPPTKEELMSSNEGHVGKLPTNVAARRQKVDELYELFMAYVDGIHVG